MPATETLLLVNPRRRRKSSVRKSAKRRMRRNPVGMYLAGANPSRRRRRFGRRNPIGGGSSAGVGSLVQPVMWGAIGATGVTALVNLLPLPVTMKTGVTGAMTRAAAAVALATVGRRLVPNARQMAVGSLICTTKEVLDGVVGGLLPSATMAGLGYYAPAFNASPRRAPVLTAPQQAGRLQGMGQVVTAGGVAAGKIGGSKLSQYLR